jgi:hypothetical protein
MSGVKIPRINDRVFVFNVNKSNAAAPYAAIVTGSCTEWTVMAMPLAIFMPDSYAAIGYVQDSALDKINFGTLPHRTLRDPANHGPLVWDWQPTASE